MLDPVSAFSVAGPLVMLGWLGLIVALFVKAVRPVVWTAAQFVIPALLAAAYVLLLWQSLSAFDAGGFGSIEEIRLLFAHDGALVAGWFHYLAFDLFVGAWISRDSAARGISPFLALPCLPLAFLFGPAGLLLYLALRLAFRSTHTEAVQ